ncbi:hypothetical protein CERZMDRAFT_88773 [Cercospora zeae-maydis SCOH1-5]|uniref:Uncharacterized protein n=1 Tax=Cercospora zeae-maydis SCOH1-5 TaxID=717836 RepID=A0A6A6F0G1_9PEZI|nr:hypothetical protein CERZMDRAFT_88773 [Cercospora zeae-maydis SCOH1-5]
MGLVQIALVALSAIGAVTARVAQPVAVADNTLSADYNNTFTAELVKRDPLVPNTATCKIYKIDNSRFYTLNIGVPPPADPECHDLLREMIVYVLINAGSGFACARTEGDQTTLQFETPDVLDNERKDDLNNEQLVNALQHVFPTVPFWHEGICHTGEYPRPNYWTGDPKNAKRALEHGMEAYEEQLFTDSVLA